MTWSIEFQFHGTKHDLAHWSTMSTSWDSELVITISTFIADFSVQYLTYESINIYLFTFVLKKKMLKITGNSKLDFFFDLKLLKKLHFLNLLIFLNYFKTILVYLKSSSSGELENKL